MIDQHFDFIFFSTKEWSVIPVTKQMFGKWSSILSPRMGKVDIEQKVQRGRKQQQTHLTLKYLRISTKGLLLKMVLMNLFARQEEGHRLGEWTCGHSRGGRWGDDWEGSTDIYTLPCIKSTASGKLLDGRGSSARGSAMTQRGEMGVGGSLKREWVYVYIQLIHTVVQQKPTRLCKAIILQLKRYTQNHELALN